MGSGNSVQIGVKPVHPQYSGLAPTAPPKRSRPKDGRVKHFGQFTVLPGLSLQPLNIKSVGLNLFIYRGNLPVNLCPLRLNVIGVEYLSNVRPAVNIHCVGLPGESKGDTVKLARIK